MSTQRKTYDVFLSYAHKDEKDFQCASGLVARMEDAGLKVCWDKHLVIGDDWHDAITAMMTDAYVMVGIWSALSLSRPLVQFEATYGLKHHTLLPVQLGALTRDDLTEEIYGLSYRYNRASHDAPDLIDQIVAKVDEAKRRAAQAPHQRISLVDVLSSGQKDLFGREAEESLLQEAWASCAPDAPRESKTNMVVLHAIGGAGKTALLRRMVDTLQAHDFPHADKVLGWSAYSQGAGDDRNADAGRFIEDALGFMGHQGEMPGDETGRARLLVSYLQATRTLLILDGIEPLQHLEVVNEGRLKDKGLAHVVTQMARHNPGLVVITSRQPLPETDRFDRPIVVNHALDHLSPQAGAMLLRDGLGCHGKWEELEAASEEADGHALTLTALGGFLAHVERGDIARRDHFKLGEIQFTAEELAAPDKTVRAAKKAGRIFDAYVQHFTQLEAATPGKGAPELMLLNIMGLFDRPAEGEAVRVLLEGEPIAGLTDAWARLPAHVKGPRLNGARTTLRTLKLLAAENPDDIDGLDAHPVLRAHFAAALKRAAPEAHRAAHERLYGHYATISLPESFRSPVALGLLALATILDADQFGKWVGALADGSLPDEARDQLPAGLRAVSPQDFAQFLGGLDNDQFARAQPAFLPGTLDEMQPLFLAIAHGCAAGRHQEVWTDVYWRRVLRGNAAFINKQLGAFGADLGALAQFFDPPWSAPVAGLGENDRAVALNYAGFSLRALGRLGEAIVAERASLVLRVAAQAWENAAGAASNLSELYLAAGQVGEAIAVGREAIAHADRSGDAFMMMGLRTTLGDALAQAGQMDEAEALFAEAEARQAARQPSLPRLYSLPGYQICDLRLARGRATEARGRAERNLPMAISYKFVLDIGLDTLTLARVLALEAAHGRAAADEARARLDAAVDRLQKAGQDDYIPRGLLARAEHLRRMGLYAEAGQDLDEVNAIAARGGMKLFLTDWRLESARLCLAQINGAPPEWLVPLSDETDLDRPPPKLGDPPPVLAPIPWPQPAPATRSGRLDPQERALFDEAAKHYHAAKTLIHDTGYHRRDRELKDLFNRLDALRAFAA